MHQLFLFFVYLSAVDLQTILGFEFESILYHTIRIRFWFLDPMYDMINILVFDPMYDIINIFTFLKEEQ